MDKEPSPTPFPDLSQGSSHPPGPADTFPEIEGYRILEELPRGGQAVVYKALHLATKTKVALKVLHPDFHHSSSAKRYFEQEVELAARLHHPNIVSIRDSGIIHGLYYFAMEYVRGQALDTYLDTHELNLRDKLVLFTKICDAMAHAHQRGVIHRDLKPSNMRVDDRGEPHVLDFGLAKTVGPSNPSTNSQDIPTMTGEIRGTLAYMSPEQAEGHVDRIDVRTDVYSLGVILYRMLTGDFPYDVTGSALNTLETIRSSDPVRPRTILTKLDSDVEAIIMKCLAKMPEHRYQSSAELRDEIQRWMDGLPILAKSVSSVYLLRKVITRHRYTSSVVGLLVLIIVGFSCLSLNLHLAAQEASLKSASLAEQWNLDTNAHLAFAQQMTFSLFLEAWRDQRTHEAQAMTHFFAQDSKEAKGSLFLLYQASSPSEVASFPGRFPEEEKWFACYVLSEHFRQHGQREEALDMVQQGLEELQGLSPEGRESLNWYVHQMQARIRDLSVTEND